MSSQETISSTLNLPEDRTWQPLRLFNYYRFTLAVILMVLFLWHNNPSPLGKNAPNLFQLCNIIYLLFAAISIYTIRSRQPGFRIQLLYQVLVDISILTLFIHSSGGLASGLGILVVISVACSSLLLSGKQAIFIASIATIAVLVQTVYLGLQSAQSASSYTHAGLLGIAIFATSWISLFLSKRLHESEARVIQQEIDLANLEQLNDYIIQNFHSGILVVDQAQRVKLVNEAARSLLNNKTIKKNQTLDDICPPLSQRFNLWREQKQTGKSHKNTDDPASILASIKIGKNTTDVSPNFIRLGTDDKTGVIILLENTSVVIEKLQQMKLAALGRLTASIAHEIRNPLAAINHAAQLLEESPKFDQQDLRLVQIVIEHCRRMNTVVENILQLSRKQTSQPQLISIHSWLISFRQEFCLTNNLQESQIKLNIKPENTLIQMDSSHLYQIISNLCQNALIHSYNNQAKQLILIQGGIESKSANPYLEIIDFGKGIAPEIAQKIFEPFFTTSAHGTGLGLYITRELCECNHAHLSYTINNSIGSCFRIHFNQSVRMRA